ncbi:hypothetical protein Btru_071906 [Bulinus truncatus]|nr:hypothetical protein Btru_071906 [Bulinus truncatus]
MCDENNCLNGQNDGRPWNDLRQCRENINQVKQEAEMLYQRAKGMKYKQFSATESADIFKSILELIETHILYTSLWEQMDMCRYDGNTLDIETFDFYMIIGFVFDELKTLKQMEMLQNVVGKFQELKQKYYTLSNTDTCKDFVKTLNRDANELKEEMERKELDQLFSDLFTEFNHFMKKLQQANKNTNKQIALESVSGVLSLGSAVASGAIGAVAIASTAVSSTASAGSTASKAAVGARSIPIYHAASRVLQFFRGFETLQWKNASAAATEIPSL